MSCFIEFLQKLASHCGLNLSVEELGGEDEYELAANILNEINRFLYQKKKTLPSKYISEFHRYWEQKS